MPWPAPSGPTVSRTACDTVRLIPQGNTRVPVSGSVYGMVRPPRDGRRGRESCLLQALRGQSLVVAVAQFRPHFASGAALSSAGRGPGLFSHQLRRPTQASGHRKRDRRDERLIPLGGSRRNSSPSIGAELKRRRVGAPLSLGLPRRTATIVRSGPARRSTQGLSHVHSGPTRRPTTPFSIRRTLQL